MTSCWANTDKPHRVEFISGTPIEAHHCSVALTHSEDSVWRFLSLSHSLKKVVFTREDANCFYTAFLLFPIAKFTQFGKYKPNLKPSFSFSWVGTVKMCKVSFILLTTLFFSFYETVGLFFWDLCHISSLVGIILVFLNLLWLLSYFFPFTCDHFLLQGVVGRSVLQAFLLFHALTIEPALDKEPRHVLKDSVRCLFSGAVASG